MWSEFKYHNSPLIYYFFIDKDCCSWETTVYFTSWGGVLHQPLVRYNTAINCQASPLLGVFLYVFLCHLNTALLPRWCQWKCRRWRLSWQNRMWKRDERVKKVYCWNISKWSLFSIKRGFETRDVVFEADADLIISDVLTFDLCLL